MAEIGPQNTLSSARSTTCAANCGMDFSTTGLGCTTPADMPSRMLAMALRLMAGKAAMRARKSS